MKVDENDLRILSRLKNSPDSAVLDKYNIEVTDNGFACVDIQKSEEAFQVLNIFNENKMDDAPASLFLKRFKVQMESENEELLYDEQLFEPKFEAVGFCISRISFFVEKSVMYSVEMDYDFERSITISINRFIPDEKEAKLFFKETPWILEDILCGIKGCELDE